MINSIVANVVPPNVPSARKGIAFYGQVPVKAEGVQVPSQAPVCNCTNCECDKFEKQPKEVKEAPKA